MRYEVKTIPGFPGYFADTFGEVYSTRGRRHLRRLTLHPADDGYLKVTVRRRGRPVHCMVCRLVCAAFRGRPTRGQCARHTNGKRTDNRPSNLTWGTRSENERDKRAHGTSPDGHRNGRSKLTLQQVRRIRASKAEWQTLADRYDVTVNTIARIQTGRLWKRVAC